MSPAFKQNKERFPVQSELEVYSLTQSADEERLLQLYRDLSVEDRSRIIFKVTRLRFAPYFAEHFNPARDEQDASYLYEELEESVLLALPEDCLFELRERLHPIQFRSLFNSAWGSMATVILGTSEEDGQRADSLFSVVQEVLKTELRGHLSFSRQEALDVIEKWREAVLQLVFKSET